MAEPRISRISPQSVDGQPPRPARRALAPAMRAICGAANVLTDPLELRTYECDGLTSHRATPALVVLPESADQVAAVVRACARAGRDLRGARQRHRPVRRRRPERRGRADRHVADAPHPRDRPDRPAGDRRARRHQPVGDGGGAAVRPVLRAGPFVPGGLLGGRERGRELRRAHCLKHGFTVNHVLGLEIVTPAGELTWLGDGTGVGNGYDLLGAFTGSEGTLGIVTKIVVKLTPVAEAVHLVLAAYHSLAAGGRAVTDIIGAGIVPAAIEMMDALSIEAAEAAVHCEYPEGAAAVLLVELDGPAAEVEAELATVRALCERRARGRSARPTTRCSAPGSGPGASRRSPRSGGSLPPTSCRTGWCPGPRSATCSPGSRRCRPSPASGWRTSSTPGTGTCTRWSSTTTPCPVRRSAAEALSGAILDTCIAYGGSITGEHGVGRGQVPVHAENVHRRRPGHDAAGSLRLRPGVPLQSGQDLPHPAAVR